jgi:uncharacterized phage protein gp47/JayE
MPIETPEYQEIVDRIRADIAQNLPGTDPTIFGSYLRAFADSQAGRSFDIVLLFKQLVKELFPQTASSDFLEIWAAYEVLTRNAAEEASGLVTFTGTASSIIPTGTQVRSTDGNIYQTQASLTIAAQSISVSSLARSGSTVTATTASDHNLATGQQVTIAGANETEYNGLVTITVTGTNTFIYTITGTPSTPATGTITAAYDGGSVEVESEGTGQDKNLESGAQLSLVSPIAGVDTTAFVQFTEVGGGTDVESDDDLLARVLQSRSNPVANFNVPAIEKAALSVAGVTRVKVKRITPRIGAVTILFVRDNDTNIIPSAGEVDDVKAAIDELLPATSDTSDVVVTAPTPITTNYDFTTISPDTTTMRTAIEANLAAFYTDEVDFETDITEDKYKAVIINTIDPETGDTLDSFSLNSPSSDIVVGTDSIGVFGTVTF